MQQVYETSEVLTKDAAEQAARLIAELAKSKSKVRVLLTGGTLGIQVLADLATLPQDLNQVEFYFGDERFVPLGHADRNEAQGLAVWPSLEKSLIRFPDSNLPLAQAEREFNARLESEFGPLDSSTPIFDLVLLGMGPDGHIASLFPGVLHKHSWIVSDANSPKPPAERLSFSYEALNRSDRVWFLVSGSQKAPAVKCAISENCDLPIAKVKGRLETKWFMDQELKRAL
jgi:6-phosphogluconolactonase